MAFTAQDVKALREKTGVGMMECKKALTEADGDMEKAVDRILKAIQTQEKTIIYGDYDVDGITSSTVLKSFFKKIINKFSSALFAVSVNE